MDTSTPTADTTTQPADVQAVDAQPAEGSATEDWQAKYQELYEQHLRLAADFENFRKRRIQEMEHSRKYGAESMLTELVPVLDNLERAQKSLREDSEPKVLFQSFQLMQRQLMEALESIGLSRMQTQGKPFDPAMHEAVGRQESADVAEDTILVEHQPGYLLHDRVIRPATVVVATQAAPAPDANPFK